MTDKPAPIRLASTVMLARDRGGAMELCMVVRHHEIDFASGALVFPGGSVDAADGDARSVADGAEAFDDDALAARVAAVREAFEECGVLLARRGGEMVSGAEAEALGGKWRTKLEAGETTMGEVAALEGLTLATDLLTPFARWVTPPVMPKRFDTHFFIVEAPEGHALSHDGAEAVDSLWITPADALAEARAGTKTVIFPTRLNLSLAAEATCTADCLARAAARRMVSVMPDVTRDGDHLIMRIPEEAGYGAGAFRIKGMTGEAVPYAGA